MKATAQPIAAQPANIRERMGVFTDLFKARLTTLVLLTTLVGFYVGWTGAMNYALLFHTLLGTALLASGAAALNQWLEREHDARMRRTCNRPLPSGRLQADTVLLLGTGVSAAGLLWLAMTVNLLCAVLGILTLGSYLFIYTPLKRRTHLNTIVGAVPGALPPLMGWVAASGEITLAGWALFAILFFWQMPHFLAIAWLYREDYDQAGFVMLPSVDPDGRRTASQAISHTLGLLPASLSPFVLQLAGPLYLVGALLLGGFFLWRAVQFSRALDEVQARRLFYASIIYLPALLGLMVLDKV
jgi:heme o synthase